MSVKVLILGAGAAANLGALPALRRLEHAVGTKLEVDVFDRGKLTAEHRAHPDLYPTGAIGANKAEVLADRLRGDGHRTRAYCGNVSRWPVSAFAANLALVALDEEPARSLAGSMLRRAGTAAVFVGIADTVSFHVIAKDPDAACYDCQAQDRIPVGKTSCVPTKAYMSTRAACTAVARRLLVDALPQVCVDALAGRGLSTFRSLTGDRELVARMTQHAGCFGHHDAWPEQTAANAVQLAGNRTLADVFATLGDDAVLHGLTLRHDYFCPQCARTDLAGSRLIRQWPQRERCVCGSAAVQPLLQLDTIDRREASRLELIDHSLRDLGLLPGAQFLAVHPGSGTRLVHVNPDAQRALQRSRTA